MNGCSTKKQPMISIASTTSVSDWSMRDDVFGGMGTTRGGVAHLSVRRMRTAVIARRCLE